MKKYKHLLKNMGALSAANLLTKLIGLLIVPFYTSILTTQEYGTYDLLQTTVTLLIPILTLNMGEGVVRFAIENESHADQPLRISIKYYVAGLLGLLVIISINNRMRLIGFLVDYSAEFMYLYVTAALLGIIINYARGIERVKDVAMSGILGALATMCLNLLLLLYYKKGLKGYLYATIIGSAVQIIYLTYKTSIVARIRKNSRDSLVEKEMLAYSAPLILNSTSWWINNAADRYIITAIQGIDENGVYSMGYKIPTLLTLFNTVFNQVWILSSVKEFDNKDSDGFFTNTYRVYNAAMVIMCSGMIAVNERMAMLLFRKEFYGAYIYSPFLLISVVFGALSGYMGGVFGAVRKTKITAYTITLGAAVNIVLNVLLIKQFGTIGAAISTACSYCFVWIIRYSETKKILELRISLRRDLFCYSVLTCQAIVYLLITNVMMLLIVEAFCCMIIIITYKEELRLCMENAMCLLKQEKKYD